MLKFRTTKEVPTSLQTDDKNRLEFHFWYHRSQEGMRIVVDAYAITGEECDLLGGNGSDKVYTLDELAPLITAAKSITPEMDDPLQYFDALVASGVKIAITSVGYWRNQLSMSDFE